MYHHSRRFQDRHTRLFIEPLESRRLLATLVNAKTVTYQDVDGDTVTVALSKAVLTSSNVNSVFNFDSGSVNGVNTAGQQLQLLDLTQLGAAAVGGSNLTITAKPSANGGDGLVNVGFINGTGINLGTVSVHGDLGRIDAGDGTSATLGLNSLSVLSMGSYGTTTQAAGGNLESDIVGQLGKLTVASDIVGAYIHVTGPGGAVLGTIGSVSVGGSLLGTSTDYSGTIQTGGSMGSVNIKGDLDGGSGYTSGSIVSGEKLGNVTIGGSVIGGSLKSFSGEIESGSDMGAVTIGHDLQGGGANYSGQINSGGRIASVKIGGSVVGGGGEVGGNIHADGDTGSVTIGGNLQGTGGDTGGINVNNGKLASVKIGGSLIGGSGVRSGYIDSGRDLGAVTIGGSVISGTASGSGAIIGDTIIGQVKIGGSIVGNDQNPFVISALGQATPMGHSDLAIAGLTVGGRVEDADIYAGYSFDGINFNPTSADAQIGNVSVSGDWITSELLAGAVKGLDAFGKISDPNDNPKITSSIASINIGGQLIGSIGSIPVLGVFFGFATEQINSFTVAGTKFKLHSGPDNDEFNIGVTDNMALREV